MQEEMLTESVYFKESMDSPYQGAPLSMMLELICQRLQQGFQVYMGDSYEKDGRLTYRTTMGRNIHELSMDMSSDVDKTIDIRVRFPPKLLYCQGTMVLPMLPFAALCSLSLSLSLSLFLSLSLRFPYLI